MEKQEKKALKKKFAKEKHVVDNVTAQEKPTKVMPISFQDVVFTNFMRKQKRVSFQV